MPDDNPLVLPSENISGNKVTQSIVLKIKDGHWLDWHTCNEENYYARLLLGDLSHSLITDEMVKVNFETIKKYWDTLYESVNNGNASIIKKTHPGIDLDAGFDRVIESYRRLNTKNGRDEYDIEFDRNRIIKGKSVLRSSLESKVKEKTLSAESESQLFIEKGITQYLNKVEIAAFVEEYLSEYGIKRATENNHTIDPGGNKLIPEPPNYRVYIKLFIAAIFFVLVLLTIINLNHKNTSLNLKKKAEDSIAIEQSIVKKEQNRLRAEKIKAETEKIKAETEKVRIEAEAVLKNSQNPNSPNPYPNQIEQIEKYKSIIRDFVIAEDNRDLNKIINCFSTDLVRYWDLSYPTHDELIAKYLSVWNKSYQSKNIVTEIRNIDNQTFDLLTEYEYSEFGRTKPFSRTSTVRFHFDDNGKIDQTYGVIKN
ncbi:MAG: hypothetical protein WCK85_06260 [Chlorobium sp.]